MTVAELIAELSVLPPDTLVIIQKDAEGNDYSPYDGMSTGGKYEAYSTWSGQVHYDEDLEEEGEEMPEGAVPCVVLCPVN